MALMRPVLTCDGGKVMLLLVTQISIAKEAENHTTTEPYNNSASAAAKSIDLVIYYDKGLCRKVFQMVTVAQVSDNVLQGKFSQKADKVTVTISRK